MTDQEDQEERFRKFKKSWYKQLGLNEEEVENPDVHTDVPHSFKEAIALGMSASLISWMIKKITGDFQENRKVDPLHYDSNTREWKADLDKFNFN